MIEKGQEAPDFELPDQDGRTVRLSDLRGQSVVVYFYPKADTPGCNRSTRRIHDLVKKDLQERYGFRSRPRRSVAAGHSGQRCPRCGDTLRAVNLEDYVIAYCATDPTQGPMLKDRRLSRLLE